MTRLIMWSVVGLLAIVFIYLNAQSPPATTTQTRPGYKSNTQVATNADGVLPSDYTAHFARYTGGKRDPFIPLIATDQGAVAHGHSASGDWELTGISSIDNVPSALVENSSSGESVFLSKGDHWHGLTVVAIGTDSVEFVNALGQRTQLAFPVSQDDAGTGTGVGAGTSAGGSSNLPTATQVRPLPQVGSLPPMPVSATPATPGTQESAQQ